MIDNISSNKGKSKFVFKVIYNELPYVAKRCYTLGNGIPVSIIANRNELIKEATTLGHAKSFLANFKDKYFEVTDFIIACEGVHRVPEDLWLGHAPNRARWPSHVRVLLHQSRNSVL
ncbi:hypothetical protein DFH08DRAFT_808716 [Mycena albidolilacea]|uniref:Uncharacterized protein n=1 Tax=Mycena albidolilacea TaxID=1033008 RepID=A0AAD7A203_9AGAR|nr:hypothetical protein DFH08DRAFT_808716 [Mycena albidolilacea]